MSKIIFRLAVAGALIGIINNILLFLSFSTGMHGLWSIFPYADRGEMVLLNAILTIIFFLIILFPGLVSKQENS